MSRTKAASLLGGMGDPAAIPHLQEALRRSYSQGSPLWHCVLGWIVTVEVVLGSTVLYLLVLLLFQSAPMFKFGEIGEWLLDLRRGKDPFVRACIRALAQIAERDSSPESSAIVPFLRGIAADPLHHSSETRATARLAAERIEDQTRQTKHMPLAAAAPEVDPAQLPIAATRT